MAEKSARSGDVEPFQVRWMNEDIEADLPKRFKEALRICAVERAPLTRTLIRKWVQEIESRGGCADAAIERTLKKTISTYPPRTQGKVNYSLNESPPRYGAAKRKGKKS